MGAAQEIIDKYHLGRHIWVHKGAHSVLHTIFPATINLLKPLQEYWGDSFRLFVFFVMDNYLHWYYNEEDMTRLRKQLVEKINSDPTFLERFEKDWRTKAAVFEQKCHKMDSTNLSMLSDEALLDLYREFFDAYVQEYAVAMGLLESFSMQVDVFFKPTLEKKLQGTGRDLNELYSILLSPTADSFINQEAKDRLAIKNLMEQGKSSTEIDELLEKHAEKYHWIENNYAKINKLGVDYFKEKINLEDGKKLETDFEEVKTKKKQLIQELGLEKEIVNIMDAVERFSTMQDDRKKYVLISNHYQKLFLDEIGKRVNATEKETEYTVFFELEEILHSKSVDHKRLAERKRATLCIETLNGYEIFEGDEALAVFERVFNRKNADEEIKGVCASPGKVTGIVKIVLKTHDLASVKMGDILVASMTRPEMVSAMNKASAIITDEGGVTSHAAIVSRELGIPCIIGTKVATQLLHNGDLVLVDANNGTVQKLKK